MLSIPAVENNAVREIPIQRAVASLKHNLCALHDSMNGLESRLSAVLLPPGQVQGTPPAAGDKRDACSPLRAELDANIEHVSQMRDLVDDLLRRLEV